MNSFLRFATERSSNRSVIHSSRASATLPALNRRLSHRLLSQLVLAKECTGTADAIVCTTGELKAGRSKALRLVVVPNAGATVTVNTSVSSPLEDPDMTNQTFQVVTPVP